MYGKWERCTLVGQFDHYGLKEFKYGDNQIGYELFVILKNCTDLVTNQKLKTIRFNFTKAFKDFGMIEPGKHPRLEIRCKHYVNEESNFGYAYPSSVVAYNNRAKFSDNKIENVVMVMQANHQAGLATLYDREFIEKQKGEK